MLNSKILFYHFISLLVRETYLNDKSGCLRNFFIQVFSIYNRSEQACNMKNISTFYPNLTALCTSIIFLVVITLVFVKLLNSHSQKSIYVWFCSNVFLSRIWNELHCNRTTFHMISKYDTQVMPSTDILRVCMSCWRCMPSFLSRKILHHRYPATSSLVCTGQCGQRWTR